MRAPLLRFGRKWRGGCRQFALTVAGITA